MRHLPKLLLFAATLQLALAAEKPFAFGSVRFEENRGQTDSSARYIARARGQQIFFTNRGVILSPAQGEAVRLEFEGAAAPAWTPAGPSIDTISYFVGDSSHWVKGAPVYDRIAWRGVYPGIDVAFYGAGDRLEYDLVVAPGADPSQIRLRFSRSARLHTNPDGSLDISGILRQRVPDVYQEIAPGRRHKVAGRFVNTSDHVIGLKLGSYRRTKPLVVDPVIENFTYIGGENDDEIVATGDGFVAGNTRSLVFPPNQAVLRPSRDIFLRGLGPVVPGTNPRTDFYGTFIIGGSGDESLAGIAVSPTFSGVFLAGTTTSTDFGASATNQYRGGASDGFLAFVSVSRYYANLGDSRYIGGAGEDRITGFFGTDVRQIVVGVTDSLDLPTGDVPQKSLAGGKDAFYGLLSMNFGNTATYGYLGGSGDDVANAVCPGASGHIWIGGQTRSTDFPSATPSLSGPSDGFLTDLIYSSVTGQGPRVESSTTYLIGGSGDDGIQSLALGASQGSPGSPSPSLPYTLDQLGFAGITTSPDLPVLNAAQPRFGGDRDGFAGLWNPTTAAPSWLTYVGGSGPDEALAVNMNWAGDLYVGGWTLSTDLPVLNAVQTNNAGGEDGMFAVYDSAGSLQHLTYFGGSGDDRIRAVGVTNNSIARVAGSTTSNDLPQRNTYQRRGGQADGFLADIGSDYFIGPTQLVLAKDGLVTFSVRTGRTTVRPSITYRTSDPSRVRLVYLGRSVDEITAAPEDIISIEGLTDSGDAQITVSASGFNTKTIGVKLYPGAFVFPFFPGQTFSSWNTPSYLYAGYRAYDPASGQVLNAVMGVRPGAAPAVMNWTISDPSVFAILTANNPQLQALKSGEATLTLTVDGYQVIGGQQTVVARTPAPLPPTREFRLGKDLFANLPLNFAINGNYVSTGYRGTLTARSTDPSRLLLALDSSQQGAEAVSLTMTTAPTIWAQALAGEGTVQVIVTSSEFEGEFPITVNLEPTVAAYGVYVYTSTSGNVLTPSVSTSVGSQTQLAIALRGASGSFSSGYRPGAPPFTFRLSNSNPQVVELDRLTSVMQGSGAGYKLTGLAVGGADLSLTCSLAGIAPATPSIHVDVQAPALAASVPSSVSVGKGLQTSLTFRYLAGTGVEASVDDPSAALLSLSATQQGSSRVNVQPNISTSDYGFYIQALKSEGETTVRLHFPNEERTTKVVLLPSGAGFYGTPSTSLSDGYQQDARVYALALDRQTGIGVFPQTPQPGNSIAVRFRTDGDPVKLNQTSAVLTTAAPDARLSFTNPAAGQQATLYAESDGEFPVSAVTSSLKVFGAAVPADPAIAANVTLSRDELGTYNSPVPNATITSSDPDGVLLSTRAEDPGVPSVRLGTSSPTLYLHSLKDVGNATVKMVSAAGERDIAVAFLPLQLNLLRPNTGTVIPLRGTADFSAALNAHTLRPGAATYHFNVRTTDPSVATIDIASFDLGGPKRLTAATLHVSAVGLGSTQIIVEGPPEVYTPNALTITVSAAQNATPAFAIGRNLQYSAQIDLGTAFANPNGAIVTLTSSDPSRLLLSRAASTPGTASVKVAVPAGDHRTQALYFQALSEGDVTIVAVSNGVTQTAATVSVVPSWIACGSQKVSVAVGASQSVSCYLAYAGTGLGGTDVGPRAGLGDLTLHLASSAPEVFTVTPDTMTIQANNNAVTLRGVSAGTGQLQLAPPSGFSHAPDGSDRLTVNVTLPVLNTGCSGTMILGQDTQFNCSFSVAAGVRVTATSQDPSMLLVSTDEKSAGAESASATSAGQGMTFTFQALNRYGTVEVVLSAPGYQDFRLAFALRPVEVYLSDQPFPAGPFSTNVGNTTMLTFGLRASGGYSAVSRAGSNLTVGLSPDQAGIVSLTPPSLLFNGPQSAGKIQVKGLAAGSVLLKVDVPNGYLGPSAAIAVTVLP